MAVPTALSLVGAAERWQSGGVSTFRPLLALALVALGCGARSDLTAPSEEGGGGSGGTPDTGGGAVCGDGVIEGSEQCDDGALNGSRPALSLLNPVFSDGFIPVEPIVGPSSAEGLYAYASQSAHTGFEQPFSSVLFVYRREGASTLDLFSVHGIDQEATGIDAGDCTMSARFSELPAGWFLSVADEQQEVVAAGPSEAVGDWEWHHNSDGAVISGLPFPGSWTVRIEVDLQPCAPTWEFQDGSGEGVELAPPISLLRAYDAATCLADCTLPRP